MMFKWNDFRFRWPISTWIRIEKSLTWDINRHHDRFSTQLVVLILTIFGTQIIPRDPYRPGVWAEMMSMFWWLPRTLTPVRLTVIVRPPLEMNHTFVVRGKDLDMISIIWLFILLIIELQIMATNRNILLYLICNWKTERPDSILDLRYKPRDNIKIDWKWTAVLLVSFWAFSVSYVWPPPFVSNFSPAKSKMDALSEH